MVKKILEEAEEEHSESTSRRLSVDTSPPHTPSPRPSTSSNHHFPLNHIPSPPPPGSPDSSSSISSAHTFHGYSAKPSPVPTPTHPSEPHQSPAFSGFHSTNTSPSPPPPPLRPMVAKKAPVVSRLIRDAPPASVAKTESGPVTGFADAGGTTDYESGMDGSVGGEERGDGGGRWEMTPSISRRAKRVIAVRSAAVALRWFEFAVCLVAFAVMAADRNRGWALDSFDRYKEFRYSMAVSVIGFVYSGLQGCCSSHQLRKGKHITQSQIGSYIEFMVDQMLAYLLMSASSSAATRVDDWVMNWGNDKFTTMAGASVVMSFLAFLAFALSSLISGYLVCTRRSTT